MLSHTDSRSVGLDHSICRHGRLNGQDQALPEAELVVLEPSPDPASALPEDPR
jgi:hypothetical protein